MEDKTFELIEKLYSRMEEGFSDLHGEINGVKTELKQDMARMEQKFDDKISALFDGLTVNTEAVERLELKVDSLGSKVDNLDLKVQGNTKAIERLEVKVRENTEAINGLKGEMQKLETKVDEHEVRLRIVK